MKKGPTVKFFKHTRNSARASAAGHCDVEFVMVFRHVFYLRRSFFTVVSWESAIKAELGIVYEYEV